MERRTGLAPGLRLAAIRYRFQENLFLLPVLIMGGGVVLAVVATAVDDAVGHDASLPLALAMSSNAATWLLATVAGAMITTVGVVFSLTVVSLQLASDHFSPRVMRSFIRDRLSQAVIGLLVGTFFYCVLVLPNVSGEATDPAPQVSLTVAVGLTILTVAGIIVHLDHLARGLQVGNVVRLITTEGEAVVADLGTAPRRLEQVDPHDYAPPEDATVIACRRSGWVSQVDVEHALRAVSGGPSCAWRPGSVPTSTPASRSSRCGPSRRRRTGSGCANGSRWRRHAP